MNLKLKLDLPSLLKLGRQFGPTLAGLALVGIFGYTGWIINRAFNVQPSADSATAPAAPRITFDQKTITAIKNLHVVPGQVAPADLGKSDPFGN
ncbi:MAG TPA: hypothetical protein VLI05_01885 [Candidatus Saccharimonadia bacterium]|nr:hypothetical protein [Candidatus Saccharimonadia bacterium]